MMNKLLALLACLSVAACGLPVQGTDPSQDAPFPAPGDRLTDSAPTRQGKDTLPTEAANSKIWAETFVCLAPVAAGATVRSNTDADCQVMCYDANMERKMRLEQGWKACPADFTCTFQSGDDRADGYNVCHIASNK